MQPTSTIQSETFLKSNASPQLDSASDVMNAYATWTVNQWLPATTLEIDPVIASRIVMVMGVGGETGEVVELIDQWMETGACDRPALVKELGDVIYYWARTMREFDLDAGAVFQAGLQSNRYSMRPIHARAMKLVVAQARVLEAYKKNIRDGHLNGEKFSNAMADVAREWHSMCVDIGVCWRDVLVANRDKMASRTARGTLRGSGDER
jgi:hypothetical protein